MMYSALQRETLELEQIVEARVGTRTTIINKERKKLMNELIK